MKGYEKLWKMKDVLAKKEKKTPDDEKLLDELYRLEHVLGGSMLKSVNPPSGICPACGRPLSGVK